MAEYTEEELQDALDEQQVALTPQIQEEQVAVAQQAEPAQGFVRWDTYRNDPDFATLEPDQKQALFDDWRKYATNFLAKTGNLKTEKDVKYTEDYFKKTAEFEKLKTPRFEPPNYAEELVQQAGSGLRSMQTGVVGFGALTGAADPAAVAKIIAKNNREAQQQYVNPTFRKYAEKEMGFFESAGQIISNPIDIMLPMFAQSIGSNLPAIGAGLAVGLATGAEAGAVTAATGVGAPVAPVVGAGAGITSGLATEAALSGVTDALVTFDQTINEELRARKLDPTDPEAVGAVLQDPEFQKKALAYSAGRGVAISATSLATLGLGRLISAPAGVMAKAGTGAVAKEFAKQTALQFVGEPTGEALAQVSGQVASGQKVELSGRDIAEETLAGLPMSATTGALMAVRNAGNLVKNNAPATAQETLDQAGELLKQEKFAEIVTGDATPDNLTSYYNTLSITEKARALGLDSNAVLTQDQGLFSTLSPEEKANVQKAFDGSKSVVEGISVEEATKQAQEAFKPKAEAPVVEEAKVEVPAPVVETPAVTTPEAKVTLAETAPATARQVVKEEAAIPAEEAVTEAVTTLPKDLQGAKPRYSYGSNQFELNFNNDLDKAFYILAQDKPSKREADYMAFAKSATGMNDAEVRLAGKRIRESIKNLAKVTEPGILEVPKSAFSERTPAVAKPVPVEPVVPTPAAETPAPVAEAPTPTPVQSTPQPLTKKFLEEGIKNVSSLESMSRFFNEVLKVLGRPPTKEEEASLAAFIEGTIDVDGLPSSLISEEQAPVSQLTDFGRLRQTVEKVTGKKVTPVAPAPAPVTPISEGVTATQDADGTWTVRWEHKRFSPTKEGVEEQTKSSSSNGFPTKEEALKRGKAERQQSMQGQIRQAEALADALEKRNDAGKDDARASRKARKVAEENKKLYEEEYPTTTAPATKKLPPTKKQVTALTKLGYLPEDLATLDRTQAKDILAKKTPKVPVEKAQEVKAEVPATGEAGPAQAQRAAGEAGQPVAPAKATAETAEPPVQEGLNQSVTGLQKKAEEIGSQIADIALNAKSLEDYYGGKPSAENELKLKAILKVISIGLANLKKDLMDKAGEAGRAELANTWSNIKEIVLRKSGDYGAGLYSDPRNLESLGTLFLDPDRLLTMFQALRTTDPTKFFKLVLDEEVIHANQGIAMYEEFVNQFPDKADDLAAYTAFYDAQNAEIENSLSLKQIKDVIGKYDREFNLEGKTKEQIVSEFNAERPGRLAEEYVRTLIQLRKNGKITEDVIGELTTKPILRALGVIKNYLLKLIGRGASYNQAFVDEYAQSVIDLLSKSSPRELAKAKTETGTAISGKNALASSTKPAELQAILKMQKVSNDKEELYAEINKELGQKGQWENLIVGGLHNAFPMFDRNTVRSAVNDSIRNAVFTYVPEKRKFSSHLWEKAYQRLLTMKDKLNKERAIVVASTNAPGMINVPVLLKTLNQQENFDKQIEGKEPESIQKLEEVKRAPTKEEEKQLSGVVVRQASEPVLETDKTLGMEEDDLDSIAQLDKDTATKTADEEVSNEETRQILQSAQQNLGFGERELDIIKNIQGLGLSRAEISAKHKLSNNEYTELKKNILNRLAADLAGKGMDYRALRMASSVDPIKSEALSRALKAFPAEISKEVEKQTYLPFTREELKTKSIDFVNKNSMKGDPINASRIVMGEAAVKNMKSEDRIGILTIVAARLKGSLNSLSDKIRKLGSSPEDLALKEYLSYSLKETLNNLKSLTSAAGQSLNAARWTADFFTPELMVKDYTDPITDVQKEQLASNVEAQTVKEETKKLIEKIADESVEAATQAIPASEEVTKAKDELKKFATQEGASTQSLESIVTSLLPNFTEAQVKALVSLIVANYNKQVNQIGKIEVEKIAKAISNPKQAADTNEKILKLVKLGSFSEEKLYNAIASKYELPSWSSEIADTIKKMAEDMDRMPAGSDQRATKALEIQKYIANELIKQKNGKEKFAHLVEIGASLWKAGVLSGVPTQIVNFGATHLNVLLESIGEVAATAAAADKKLGVKGLGMSLLKDAIGGYIKAIGNMGFDQASDTFATGLSRFRNETQMQLTPLEAFDFDTKKLWKFSNYLALWKQVGRAMAAADGYNSVIASEIKARLQARYSMLKDGLSGEEAAKLMDKIFAEDNPAMKEIQDQVDRETEDKQFGSVEGLTPGSLEYRREFNKIEAGKRRRFQQLREQYIASSSGMGENGLEQVRKFQSVATFNNDPEGVLGLAADKISSFGAQVPAASPFTSFTRTVANIVNSSLNYTPYGFARAYGWTLGSMGEKFRAGPYAFKTPEKGSVEFYKLLGQAFFGTAGIAVIATMAGKDIDKDWDKADFAITGRGPTDPNRRLQLQQTGWTPNTVKIGGLQFRHTDIPALGVVFGALATVSDAIRYGNLKADDLGSVAWLSAMSMGNVVFDKNLMSGLKSFFDVVSDQGDPAKRAQRLAQSVTGGFINPGIARWLTSTLAIGPDGKIGQTDMKALTGTTKGWLLSMTPLAVLADKPLFDRLGEPIRQYPWAPTMKRVGFLPEVSQHPVFTPLINAGLVVPGVSSNFKIQTYQNGRLDQRKMDTQEFYDFAKYNGDYLRRVLTPGRAEAIANVGKTDHNTAQKQLQDMARAANDYAKNRIEAQIRLNRK
jgi:hypothetical protein